MKLIFTDNCHILFTEEESKSKATELCNKGPGTCVFHVCDMTQESQVKVISFAWIIFSSVQFTYINIHWEENFMLIYRNVESKQMKGNTILLQ